VRIGIDAPRHVPVHRLEVRDAIERMKEEEHRRADPA
jgi:sRNA-binding carbon storage regulator CsrA